MVFVIVTVTEVVCQSYIVCGDDDEESGELDTLYKRRAVRSHYRKLYSVFLRGLNPEAGFCLICYRD